MLSTESVDFSVDKLLIGERIIGGDARDGLRDDRQGHTSRPPSPLRFARAPHLARGWLYIPAVARGDDSACLDQPP